MDALQAILPVIAFLVVGAVLVVLFVGLLGMARGGDFNKRYGNKVMRLRVILQGVAVVVIVVLALVVGRN